MIDYTFNMIDYKFNMIYYTFNMSDCILNHILVEHMIEHPPHVLRRAVI